MCRCRCIALATLTLAAAVWSCGARAQLTETKALPANLTVEYLPATTDPFLDVDTPRFSWKLVTATNFASIAAPLSDRGIVQAAFELEVRDAVGDNVVWSSGRVNTSQQLHVAYDGDTLQSHWSYTWAVRVWTGVLQNDTAIATDNYPSSFVNGSFRTAFLGASAPGWLAPWVTSSSNYDHDRFRTQGYEMPSDIEESDVAFVHAYFVGLGYGHLRLNGRRVASAACPNGQPCSEELGPWTTWTQRLLYRAYNIPLQWLNFGGAPNTFGVELGQGQWRSKWTSAWIDTTKQQLPLLLRLQVHAVLHNGSSLTLHAPASSWNSTNSPRTFSDVYAFHGIAYDETPVSSWMLYS